MPEGRQMRNVRDPCPDSTYSASRRVRTVLDAWVGTNENVRLKLLDAVGLKRSGRVAVFNSLQPDITAVGRDRLHAEQQKSRRAGSALRRSVVKRALIS